MNKENEKKNIDPLQTSAPEAKTHIVISEEIKNKEQKNDEA